MDSASRTPQTSEAVRQLKLFSNAAASVKATSALDLFAAPRTASRQIFVEVGFLRAPRPNRVPLFIDVPHDVVGNGKICLITPAPQRQFKDELESAQASDLVAKVLDVSKLEAKFSNPVARRGLAKAFDVFFVHSELEEYPTLLTGEFLSRQTPVWMDSKKGTLVERINRTKRRVVCPRRGYDNVAIAAANVSMTEDAIEANIHAVLDHLSSDLEGGWQDILAVRLSASNERGQRISLPIFAHNFAESSNFPAADAAKKRARS